MSLKTPEQSQEGETRQEQSRAERKRRGGGGGREERGEEGKVGETYADDLLNVGNVDRDPGLPHDLDAGANPGDEDELGALGQLVVADRNAEEAPRGSQIAESGLEPLQTIRTGAMEHNVVAGLTLVGGNEPRRRRMKSTIRV